MRDFLTRGPVSDRLLTARLRSRLTIITIVQCYAPRDTGKMLFVGKCTQERLPKGDIVIVVAKMGSKKTHVMGPMSIMVGSLLISAVSTGSTFVAHYSSRVCHEVS